jgi:light-regulated signal transduction histidine kinase (bacteriophytochrome)
MGKRNKLDELILENQELASKILVAHQEMIDELINSKKEFFIQNAEKKKQVANLINANKAMSDELSLAYQELAFQNIENEKRAAELVVANDKLAFQNVEKEKRAAELVVANDKLAFQNVEKEKRAADLVIINKELEQFVYANKELKQFAYIASHELKEPIRTIANFIQIISEDYSAQLDEKAIEYLRIINDSTKRMTILINSLLHFSRLGVDKKLSYVDCKEIIDSVISDLTDIIKSSDATIEVSEMPKLNVYEIEFRQIFQNLITNAIKFQKKGSHPEIQIRSEEINENFRFSVSDNGIGIDPTYFDRVFDIFQRLHNTEEVFEGKGIGLAYCKKIVQLHQGEIWIESELGKGSTFYFTIFKTLTV